MKIKWFYTLLIPILVLFGIFNQTTFVSAAEVGDVITKMYVTDADGKELTGDLAQWQQFRIYAEFALPDNTINKGDTTSIKIPDEINFGTPLSFDIKASDGNVVAKAVANPDTKTLTLTYTDYVETHSGVKGTFYFNALVDFQKVTERTKIPLNIVIEGKVISAGSVDFEGVGNADYSEIYKSGWTNTSDPLIIEWLVAINRTESRSALNNVIVTDTLRDGLEYVPGSFRILLGDWVFTNGDWVLQNPQDITANHPVEIDGTSYTVDLGDIPEGKGVRIRYQTKILYEPVSGENFYNDATLTSDEYTDSSTTGRHTWLTAGGQAEGYNFTIKINKIDPEGNPLSGAVFDVIRVRNNQVVGQITSDSNGQGRLGGLLRDQYILREVTAPNGYEAAADIIINPADFTGSDKDVTKDIINNPITTTTTTTTEEPTTTEAPTTTTEEPTTTEAPTTTTEEPTTTEAPTTTTEEPTTTEAPTTTTEEPTTTEAPTTTEEPTTTEAPPTTTEEPTTTEAPTTTTEEPTTTEAPTTTTEEESTTAVVTTTETPTPPSPGKKGKVLPRTGEESGFVTSLVGLGLLAVASIAVIFYRKSKKS